MTNAWLIRHYALMLVLASIVCVEVTAGSIDVSDARMPLQPGVASVYAGYFTCRITLIKPLPWLGYPVWCLVLLKFTNRNSLMVSLV